MSKKKYLDVVETLGTIGVSELEGGISVVIMQLQSYIDENPNHTDIVLSYNYDSDEFIHGTYDIVGTRKETDKERDKRLAKARQARTDKAAIKAGVVASEKAELKRLIEKYGAELINR